MLQLHCTPITEEARASDEHGFLLELSGNPTQWLFTLYVCRLVMPPNTAPLHRANWREIESLVRQLATIYQQAQLRPARADQHSSGHRARAAQRLEDEDGISDERED